MEKIIAELSDIIWGPYLLFLLVFTGIYFSFRLNFLQIFRLPKAVSYIFLKEKDCSEGDVSAFASLCTAIAATVGTGNIVGVAMAIKVGGPGAIFWMWVAGFFGMATKYAECLLGVKYRVLDKKGEMTGGPMHYIPVALGVKWPGIFFAFCGMLVALFGIGTIPQMNAITEASSLALNFSPALTTAILVMLVSLTIFGGIKKISMVSQFVIPLMASAYLGAGFYILCFNYDLIWPTLTKIITSAFNFTSLSGGVAGYSVLMAMRHGIARGVFSNESGLGSASIAAAAAKTNSPVRQGLISMTGTFLDTLVICTMTGIIIILSGVWESPQNLLAETGGSLITTQAFATFIPQSGLYIVNIGLIFFAFTTIIGWNFYGEKCTQFIFGEKGIIYYRALFISIIAVSSFVPLKIVWELAEQANLFWPLRPQ